VGLSTFGLQPGIMTPCAGKSKYIPLVLMPL